MKCGVSIIHDTSLSIIRYGALYYFTCAQKLTKAAAGNQTKNSMQTSYEFTLRLNTEEKIYIQYIIYEQINVTIKGIDVVQERNIP